MKLRNQKVFISVALCLVVLAWTYISLNHKTTIENISSSTDITNTSKPPVTINDITGVTDVFFGRFYSLVKENEPVMEPGQRFTVRVEKNANYPQIGNAHGTILVNDPNKKYKVLNSPQYIFYTKYDTKNNWYTILDTKLPAFHFEPDL